MMRSFRKTLSRREFRHFTEAPGAGSLTLRVIPTAVSYSIHAIELRYSPPLISAGWTFGVPRCSVCDWGVPYFCVSTIVQKKILTFR